MITDILSLVCGFLLFFLGLALLKAGLASLTHDSLLPNLLRATSTPLRGAAAAAVITSIVQSSSAVTVLTVSAVDSGLLTFPQSIGIILGANVGTCITAQIMSVGLEKTPLPILAVGGALIVLGRTRAGITLAAVGVLFQGMCMIACGAAPFVQSQLFTAAVSSTAANPLTGILLGTTITAVVQSSSVVVGTLIVLSQAGSLGLSYAVPIVLGCNLGTCITAFLACAGGRRGGKQVALANFLLNLFGTLAVAPFLGPFVRLTQLTSASVPHQIANAHLLFNVIVSMAFLPLAQLFAELVTFILPGDN